MSPTTPWLVALALLLVTALPTASAGPLEETCQEVADNPYAPQPIDCGPLANLIEDPTPYLERTCRAVADNPYMPLLLGCDF